MAGKCKRKTFPFGHSYEITHKSLYFHTLWILVSNDRSLTSAAFFTIRASDSCHCTGTGLFVETNTTTTATTLTI